jgi:hypothetical protein
MMVRDEVRGKIFVHLTYKPLTNGLPPFVRVKAGLAPSLKTLSTLPQFRFYFPDCFLSIV